MFKLTTLAATALVLGSLALAACGGGSAATPVLTPPPTPTPDAASATAAPAPSAATEGLVLDISVQGEDLEFDKEEMSAPAGQEVTVQFRNVSEAQQHNWLLVQDGTKDDVAADGIVAGVDNDWVKPGDPRVIAQTGLLDPRTNGEVVFTVPPAGTYQFVCTFPAHQITMVGVFRSTP